MRPAKLRADRPTMPARAFGSAGRFTESSTRASRSRSGRSDLRASRKRSTGGQLARGSGACHGGGPGGARPSRPWHEVGMRSVVQRVARAAVRVEGQVVGEVGHGLLVLLGVAGGDSEADARWTADKLAQLRVFEDEAGKMNRSVEDVGGGVLLVSQ